MDERSSKRSPRYDANDNSDDRDNFEKRRPGILRLDVIKPRRASLEIKYKGDHPSSPQPSVDRLSVTFANDSLTSDISSKITPMLSNVSSSITDNRNVFQQNTDDENSDQEEYSASVTAILQRRNSTRHSKKYSSRRPSSTLSPDILVPDDSRRRSSVFTSSSGDTVISMEDSFPTVTEDQIFENIRLHKEVLSSVKMQPWSMRKKLRLVVQAKNYIKQHEGALQERLAQSHSTRDMLASWNIWIVKKLHQMKREFANLANWVIPWELRIKQIESHFGSVVASYFIFLRWLFWVNLCIAVILIAFVVIPEWLIADLKKAGNRKQILPEEKYNSTNFLTLWDFEGVFKYSPLFYGWYTNNEASSKMYRLPLAYFITGLAMYVYSFVATLRKMAKNSRMSKLSEKEDECIFSWKLFSGWDYMIGNAETAQNRVASIVMSFKEALVEEAEKKREAQSWKVIGSRILVNLLVIGLLVLSALAVVEVVRRSTEVEATSTTWRRNEITVVMSLISLFFPIFFEVLGFFEKYHPRKQLRLQLARIMVLNLLNLYSLIFALFDKIDDMTVELIALKPNITQSNGDLDPITMTPILMSTTSISTTDIYDITMQNSSCYEICTTDETLSSYNLTELVTYLSTLAKISIEAADDFNGTRSSVLTTQSSVENLTSMFLNKTDSFDLFDNSTELGSLGLLDNFSKTFADYLQYLLFNIGNDTDWLQLQKLLPLNTTSNQTDATYNLTGNIQNFTQHLSNNLIPSTTQGSINNFTEGNFDERFETAMSVISEQIITEFTNPERNCQVICEPVYSYKTHFPSTTVQNLSATIGSRLLEPEATDIPYTTRKKLRSLCWETMFGQELVKLTIMDLILTIMSTFAIDFFRGIFVRFMNRCWCWDLEKKFPQYGDFKVAENILHLVNNQGMVWMGMFFSPGLVVLNIFKLYALMYLRSWAVMTCNVPHEIIFRASRSNNFYFALLLMMLFLCVLPVGYTIVWLEPSWHCGPFSSYKRISFIFTKTLKKALPSQLHRSMDYVASPGIVIPLLLLLSLIIYYLISLTNALRESNNDLKIQLRRERTEERRKMFQIADRRRRGGSDSSDFPNNPMAKWKKLMQIQGVQNLKGFDDNPRTTEEIQEPAKVKMETTKTKELILKFFKRVPKPKEDVNDNTSEISDVHSEMIPSGQVPPSNKSFKGLASRVIEDQKKQAALAPTHCKRKDTLDLKKRREHKQKIPEANSTPKEPITKQDSVQSNWSEKIPVIMISKTESAECILDIKADVNAECMKHEKNIQEPEYAEIKRQCFSKRQITEDLYAEDVGTQPDDDDDDDDKDLEEGNGKVEDDQHRMDDADSNQTEWCYKFKKKDDSSKNGTNSQSKTESSTEYKENYDAIEQEYSGI